MSVDELAVLDGGKYNSLSLKSDFILPLHEMIVGGKDGFVPCGKSHH